MRTAILGQPTVTGATYPGVELVVIDHAGKQTDVRIEERQDRSTMQA